MRTDILEQAQEIRANMEATVEGVEILTEQVSQIDDALIELYEMIGG